MSEAPSRSRRRSCRSSLLRWWTIKRPSPGPKLCRHFEGESLHEQAFLRPHRHNPHVGIRHHRTLHQRRHGALLRDAGCVFADDCGLVDRLSSRFQHLHDTVADKQTKLDLPAALRGAGLAEGYAISAVDFALAGIDGAEYAVLDAILAWADVDAAHS